MGFFFEHMTVVQSLYVSVMTVGCYGLGVYVSISQRQQDWKVKQGVSHV